MAIHLYTRTGMQQFRHAAVQSYTQIVMLHDPNLSVRCGSTDHYWDEMFPADSIWGLAPLSDGWAD
eukprot:3532973-Pyramimonas_sp.AAC.1